MINNAMILAAGFGKRINPLTLKHPKPLLKIGKETLLSNTLKFLELHGVKKVVINVHYLREQIIDYINNNQFNLSINIVEEKDQILDTGGGVLNAIQYFSNLPFLIINPDTIWSSNYLNELQLMEKLFFKDTKNKCSLLVVNKKKSFDQSLKGDFNLKNNLINKETKKEFIYIGCQIINKKLFSKEKIANYSILEIWNNLLDQKKLFGYESQKDFYHLTDLDIFKKLKDL